MDISIHAAQVAKVLRAKEEKYYDQVKLIMTDGSELLVFDPKRLIKEQETW